MGFFDSVLKRSSKPRAEPDYALYPDAPPVAPRFTRPEIDAALERDGVATFDWVGPDKVAALEAVVDAAAQGVDHVDVHIPTYFRLSAFNNDSTYKERLYDGVLALLADDLAALLPDYEPLVINLFEKLPHSGYDPVPIHQNPSFVDEPEHKSVSLWVPLQAVGRSNGTVGVLKGSHGRFNRIRAGNMPHEDVFALVGEELESHLFEPLELSVGQAVALDDSIIHWSYPNETDTVRRAVQLIMVPKAARHIYYYYDDASAEPMMDLYDVDRNFFFGFNCKARPTSLKHIGRVPYRYRAIQPNELV